MFFFFLPQLLGVSLEGFLNVVQRKKEAQLYRNEIRHIFTAFDVHCKCPKVFSWKNCGWGTMN